MLAAASRAKGCAVQGQSLDKALLPPTIALGNPRIGCSPCGYSWEPATQQLRFPPLYPL